LKRVETIGATHNTLFFDMITVVSSTVNLPSAPRPLLCHPGTSHRTRKRDAATEGAIRLFGLQTLAAPQGFYRDLSSKSSAHVYMPRRLA
jgi:hypothetical protein